MFSSLNPSTQDRNRRGVALFCGFSVQVLLTCAAISFGLLFPEELRLSGRRYAVAWLAASKPPEKPAVKPPRKVVVPKPQLPQTPKLIVPIVAELEVPKIRPVPPVPVPKPRLPDPPVAQPPAPQSRCTHRPFWRAGSGRDEGERASKHRSFWWCGANGHH